MALPTNRALEATAASSWSSTSRAAGSCATRTRRHRIPAPAAGGHQVSQRGQDGDEVKLTYEPPDAHTIARCCRAPRRCHSLRPAATTPAVPPARRRCPPPRTRGGAASRDPNCAASRQSPPTSSRAWTPRRPRREWTRRRIKRRSRPMLADGGFKASPRTATKRRPDLIVNVSTSKLQDGVCVAATNVGSIPHADAIFPYLKGRRRGTAAARRRHGGRLTSGVLTGITNAITKSVNSFSLFFAHPGRRQIGRFQS